MHLFVSRLVAAVTKTKGRTAWSQSSCAAGVWVDLRLLLCYPQARNAEVWCPGRGPSGPFQPLPMGTAARSGVEVISARKESPGWSRRTLMFFRFTLPPAILRYVSVMLSRNCDHNSMTELQRRIFSWYTHLKSFVPSVSARPPKSPSCSTPSGPGGASKAVCGACNGGTKTACDDCNRHILCGCRVWCQVPNSHLSTKVKVWPEGLSPDVELGATDDRGTCNAVLGSP